MLTCEHTPVKTIRTPQADINFADKAIWEDQFEYKRLMLCLPILALLSTFLLAAIFPVTKCSFLPFREYISYISWHVDKLVHFAFFAGQVTVLMCVLGDNSRKISHKTHKYELVRSN